MNLPYGEKLIGVIETHRKGKGEGRGTECRIAISQTHNETVLRTIDKNETTTLAALLDRGQSKELINLLIKTL
ncbi:MAG: hypothetical protein ACLFQV_12970 [Vulcanimicrobiota bacterium]